MTDLGEEGMKHAITKTFITGMTVSTAFSLIIVGIAAALLLPGATLFGASLGIVGMGLGMWSVGSLVHVARLLRS